VTQYFREVIPAGELSSSKEDDGPKDQTSENSTNTSGSTKAPVRFRQSTRQVAVLKSGQYFGERALLQNDVRAATVSASSSQVVAVKIPRETFTKYIAPT
jgi:CRP-like cAMP-binding protein